MKKNKFIILGGSGFLASHLVTLLEKKNKKIIILDHYNNRKLGKNVRFVKGSILEKKKLFKIIKPGDIVYHFAAVADLDEANNEHLKAIEVNIFVTVNVLEECIKNKANKLIFSSSIYARSEQGGFYSTTKLASEMLIERYSNKFKLKYTIIRFGSLYGENSNHFNTIKNLINQGIKSNIIKRHSLGNEIRNYIHVKDAVKICYSLINSNYDNKYFNLIGNEKKTIKQVIKIIAKELNIKKTIFIENPKDSDHYVVNPYTYQTRVGKMVKPNNPYKFKDSLIKLISHEKKIYSKKQKMIKNKNNV